MGLNWGKIKAVYFKYSKVNRRYNAAIVWLNAVEEKLEKRRDYSEGIIDKLTGVREAYYEIKNMQLEYRASKSRSERSNLAQKIKNKSESITNSLDYVRRQVAKLSESKPKRKLAKRIIAFEGAVKKVFGAES